MDKNNNQDLGVQQERELQKVIFLKSAHMYGLSQQIKSISKDMHEEDYLLTSLISSSKTGEVNATAIYTDKAYAVFMCQKQ